MGRPGHIPPLFIGGPFSNMPEGEAWEHLAAASKSLRDAVYLLSDDRERAIKAWSAKVLVDTALMGLVPTGD